jgi:putative transposase
MGQTKDPIYHRRSIRLKGFDYSEAGEYFITLVTHDRVSLFGEIIDGKMRLSEFGKIVREEWFKTEQLRSNVETQEDEFVVMPNHIHGIISLKNEKAVDADIDKTDECESKGTARRALTSESFGQPRPGSLATIVGAFKSAVTKRINTLRGTPGEAVWLRNYYEHIICTEKEYENIANYIHDNPQNWGMKDEYYQ